MCGGKVPGGRRLEPYVYEYQWRQQAGRAAFPFFLDTVRVNVAAESSGAAPVSVVDPEAYGRAAAKYCLVSGHTGGIQKMAASEAEDGESGAGSGDSTSGDSGGEQRN